MEFKDGCIEEEEEEEEEENEEEQEVLAQYLRTETNQLTDLQDCLANLCNVIPVFSFNSAKYDIKLRKRNFLPLFVIERGIEPIAIKKASQFVSFMFELFRC